jgi:hypothetical protein
MNPNDRFTKSYDELIVVGLHPRLALLYGRLIFHAGKDGRCFPRHITLTRELGLRDTKWVTRLLSRLRDLRLIEWKRNGPHSNEYGILVPDKEWIARWIANHRRVREVASKPPLEVAAKPPQDVAARPPIKEAAAKEADKRENPAPKPTPKTEASKPRPRTPSQPEAERNAKTASPSAAANALTPVEEFRARCLERHGPGFDVGRCIRNVQRQLEKRGGLTFEDFLAFDAAQTTNGMKSNPYGFYVHLAKQLREETVKATMDAFNAAVPETPAPAEPPRNEQGRCDKCNGIGRLLPGGEFCACKLGRDLKKLEAQDARRKPITETKPPRARKGAA